MQRVVTFLSLLSFSKQNGPTAKLKARLSPDIQFSPGSADVPRDCLYWAASPQPLTGPAGNNGRLPSGSGPFSLRTYLSQSVLLPVFWYHRCSPYPPCMTQQLIAHLLTKVWVTSCGTFICTALYVACRGHIQICSIANQIGWYPDTQGPDCVCRHGVQSPAPTCTPPRFISEINSDDNSPWHFDQPLLPC